MIEWVCSDCGSTLPKFDGFVYCVCDACGGTSPVSRGVYEREELLGDGDVFAYQEEDRDGVWFALRGDGSQGEWVRVRDGGVEVRA
jgi:hypothetical protein